MRRLFVLLLLMPGAALGADLHADATVETHIGLSRKWAVDLRTRARVIAKDNYWYDVSISPVFRYQAHPRLEVFVGTYFTWFNFPVAGWTNVYRPLVRVEPVLVKRERFSVTARTGFERFLQAGQLGDFNRYRQRFQIEGNGKWIPYANIESFFLNDGLLKTRYGCGIERDWGGRTGIEFSYFYEALDFTGAGIRHTIRTTLHLNLRD